jgi:Tol biopolymer transport system component
MNADGTNPVQLTSGLVAFRPHWSPDGQWISFTGGSPDTVFLVPAAGGAPTTLINDPIFDYFDEAWSPNGDEIAFVTSPVSGTFKTEIYKMNIRTLGLTRLTHDGGASTATWSPDGAHIAFFGSAGLSVMDPDGGNIRNLSASMQLLPWIAWSPDSRRIAVQSGNMDESEIYVIDIVTGDVKRLTYNAVYDSNPVWRPDTWK